MRTHETKAAPDTKSVRATVDALYRTDSRRILSTLIRLLGDFDLAEEALHDAFIAAMEKWEKEGIPANPRAWLVSAGRFKAIDAIRRRSRFDPAGSAITDQMVAETSDPAALVDDSVRDDELRLIFTCCHPALSPDARVALTLREVCGLTTEEIARAFLTSPPTIAQRIVRAKGKIRDAHIPYRIPSRDDLGERMETVLQVIYLVFNEGYSASSGTSLIRSDLSGEAIRLGRIVLQLLPDPEVAGLLALMLLQESRRAARTSPEGDLILLENQDRGLWDRPLIEEGLRLVQQAFSTRQFGPYVLQAGIAAVHAGATEAAQTDWHHIVRLYDLLLRVTPSPVVELNRAAAIAMCEGPGAALSIIDSILDRGDLGEYHLAHSARAEMYRRLGRNAEATTAYKKALSLARIDPERRFLEQRLSEVSETQ
jgi:RNA polymerase sigma-70 factor, ECF subfamily